MKFSSLLTLALALASGSLHAQQNNNQYFQEQQRIQQQQHHAEQARQGYMRSQQGNVDEPAGHWKTTWGSITTDAVRGVLGSAIGQESQAAAEAAAVADCQAKGGTACRIQLSYYNQCAAMILGSKVFNVASAATVEEATRLGVGKCEKEDTNCRLYFSACTKPEFVRN